MGDYNYNYKTWSYRQPLLRYYCASTDSCILYKVIDVVMTNLIYKLIGAYCCAVPFCGRVIFLHSHHKNGFKWIFSKNVYRNLCTQVTHSICYVIKFIFFATELNFCGSKKGRNFVAKAKKGSFYMMIILHELNLNNWNFLIKKLSSFFWGMLRFFPKKNSNSCWK